MENLFGQIREQMNEMRLELALDRDSILTQDELTAKLSVD